MCWLRVRSKTCSTPALKSWSWTPLLYCVYSVHDCKLKKAEPSESLKFCCQTLYIYECGMMQLQGFQIKVAYMSVRNPFLLHSFIWFSFCCCCCFTKNREVFTVALCLKCINRRNISAFVTRVFEVQRYRNVSPLLVTSGNQTINSWNTDPLDFLTKTK